MFSQLMLQSSQNEWAAAIVVASKKDDPLRSCVDYCRLNKVAKTSCNKQVKWKTIEYQNYSSVLHLNANSVFWKFEDEKIDGDMTVIMLLHGLYRLVRSQLV